MRLLEHDSLAASLLGSIRSGDIESLVQLLRDNPGAARASIERSDPSRAPFVYPLLAATTDWPGHYPRVSASIAALVAAGAEVDARCSAHHRETALHWAASSDDVEALDALLDAGADMEAPGAVIAGGTALDDAVAFAQWRAARRLVARGAHMELWHAAALGELERMRQHFADGEPPARHPWGNARSPREMVQIAFWAACHGGQREAAEYLLGRGADLRWVAPWDGCTPIEAAQRSGASELVRWLEGLGSVQAHAARPQGTNAG